MLRKSSETKEVTPESLRSLKNTQQVQKVTLLFFEKAAKTKAFEHGKPTRNFFAVRSFFSKQPLELLHLLYDYLWQLKEKQELDMSNCFVKAKEYQEKLRWSSSGGTKETYEDYRNLLDQL